jgi:hypothetical protein
LSIDRLEKLEKIYDEKFKNILLKVTPSFVGQILKENEKQK